VQFIQCDSGAGGDPADVAGVVAVDAPEAVAGPGDGDIRAVQARQQVARPVGSP
jgi:hypothetical protein